MGHGPYDRNTIFEESDWPEEPGTDYDAEMQAVNNTTSFTLNLNLTANEIVISCKISTDSDRFDSYWCNQDEQDEKNQDSTEFFQELKLLNNNLKLKELSMGMSADYLDAAKESATFLRIGSSIFGPRS